MNLKGRIGGDPELSHRGKQFAKQLGSYIATQNIPGLRVWTSWLKRTIHTAADIPAPQERWKALNEIDAVSVRRHNLEIYLRQPLCASLVRLQFNCAAAVRFLFNYRAFAKR